MELTDHNIKFMHIKGKHNISADAISRLKTLNIYKELMENPKVQVINNTQQVVAGVCATSMHTIGTDTLQNEQMWGQKCVKR